MRVFCDLYISRDDGEPLSEAEQKRIASVVRESGLALRLTPNLVDNGTALEFTSAGPTDWNEFRSKTLEISKTWKEYILHLKAAEILWPGEYTDEEKGE